MTFWRGGASLKRYSNYDKLHWVDGRSGAGAAEQMQPAKDRQSRTGIIETESEDENVDAPLLSPPTLGIGCGVPANQNPVQTLLVFVVGITTRQYAHARGARPCAANRSAVRLLRCRDRRRLHL